MRKIITSITGMLISITLLYSQPVTYTENFDGNSISFTSSSEWKIDTNYSVNAPNSIRGVVPNLSGNSIILTSPPYNLSNYNYVYLRFSHICKVSSKDLVRIEYKRKNEAWQTIPAYTYKGEASNYVLNGFSAASYPEWNVKDSTEMPAQSWWKEELFDISIEVKGEDEVQFRFILTRGNTPGTQISYGWLIDDINIIAAPYELKNPFVEFISPFINDTVYTTGPHTVNAKVKTQSLYSLQTPWLVYTSTLDGLAVTDSIEMTAIAGDSIWEGNIPQFVAGTGVHYSITGKDMQGNYTYIDSAYLIVKPPHTYGDTAIALVSIDSPVRGQTLGNINTPVIVSIRNMGDSTLTSVTVNWSVNGVAKTSRLWTGNLSWDIVDTVHIGDYIPRENMYDTVTIWITNPALSDTLTVISYGCSAATAGPYTVGSNGRFSSIDNFFDVLKDCAPSGDITLLLEKGEYTGNFDFIDLSNLMENYTLTVTSADANADSVILRSPNLAPVITLRNTRNLILKAITVDAATSGQHAIQFTGTCTNIVIRDCKLLANPTATSTSAVINKAPTQNDRIDNLHIINNLLDGGCYGFYFNGGENGAHSTNIIFDSNIVSNQAAQGISPSYVDFISCSYNTVSSRKAGTTISTSWYGLNLTTVNGPVIGNRIIQLNSAITTSHGIRLNTYSLSNTTDTGLVANNEIIINATAATGRGMDLAGISRAKIMHNSIYMGGTGTARGILANSNYNSTPEIYIIKNNNIVMQSSAAFPVYISANPTRYNCDNNNMYAPAYVGYVSGNKTTIAAWQLTITTDTHSISVKPSFIDSSSDLRLSNYIPFYTSTINDVTHDITGLQRFGNMTAMGCYHGMIAYNTNATLSGLYGWREGLIMGEEDTVKAILFNIGFTPLTTANIGWAYKGVTQSVNWNGNLALGASDTIVLGTINYTVAGNYELSAWINNIDTLHDELLEDDTLKIYGHICDSLLNGTYTIGTNVTDNFASLTDALERMKLCGVNGDITLSIQTGTYTQSANLSNISSTLNGYHLTITSADEDAEKVTLKTNDIGLILSNSNNIVIKDISIDATAGRYAIQFTGACSNVVIRDCRLLADTTSTSAERAPISKETGTGIVDSIFIINNLLDGGYYGILFHGGAGSSSTAQYGRNVVFDSNTVSNQYSVGIYTNNVDLVSCSNNTVLSLSRGTNVYASWYGVNINYTNGPVTANRIIQRTTGITSPRGISFSNHNTYNTAEMGLVANNEIILNAASSTTHGISLSAASHLRILHNSIYISGSGTARGIHITGNSNDLFEIKNNNIVANSTGTAHPIYIQYSDYLSQYDIDYNNMYAPVYVGYAGNANKANILDWQQTIVTDKHSVSTLPSFGNITQNLKLTDYTGLKCIIHPLVGKDMDNIFRIGDSTAMGAYHGSPAFPLNASLIEVVNWREGSVLGQTDNAGVVLRNTGTTDLTNAEITWTFNGNPGVPSVVNWSGSLLSGQSTVINLGTITYTGGDNTLRAWISKLNGSQNSDSYPKDDTIDVAGYVCVAPLANVYTIGTSLGKDFMTVTDALYRLLLCGANGDVVFEIEDGTYNESIDLTNISSVLGGNRLTITSASHDKTKVTLATDNIGVKLSQSNNIVLKDITIDATRGKYAVQFTDACTNVMIRDCSLLTDTTAGGSVYPLYKASGTGIVDSIFIIHNLLDGGSAGFNFTGGTGTGQFGTNVVFDSNTVKSPMSQGILPNYVDFISCSYNTVLTRSDDNRGTPSWDGIYISACNGPVIGNRVIQRSTDITTFRAMAFINYHNYNTQDMGLIANNEIIGIKNASAPAIYVANSPAKILHNSIFVSIAGTGYPFPSIAPGIRIEDATRNYVVRNNNIVMNQTTSAGSSFPVFLTSTFNSNLHDIDYNNMYVLAPLATSYVGQINNIAIPNLQTWQQTVTTDRNSQSFLPDYTDSTVNLELVNYTGLSCPFYSGVTKDIQGNSRGNVTVIGAYASLKHSMDLGIQNIIISNKTVVYPQPVPTEIEIMNMGKDVKIDSATFGWTVNGERQPSHTWKAANSSELGTGEKTVFSLGSFDASGKTNIFDIVVWIERVNGKTDSVSWNDTLSTSVKILFNGNNLRALSIEQLTPDNLTCTDDFTSIKVKIENTASLDYDFATDPVTFSIRVTQPEPFSLDPVISSGGIKSGETATLELTNMFPIIVAGEYDIEVFFSTLKDTINYDDTIRKKYLSGRFKTPIDEYFSNGIPAAFKSETNNSLYSWTVIAKGDGADSTVVPVFGDSILSFKGSVGSFATLTTPQLDLSRTDQPSLSFWYFHDTVPCEDYTDVRIIIDETTTSTLFSLTKYTPPLYGWTQYSMDLPPRAIAQCVVLVFEAMEKSRSGDVAQYIDRIRITAKQDIEITDIFASEHNICDLENKDLKVVLSNLTDPVLNYTTTPITVTLEVKETGQIFTKTLTNTSLNSFASDTITLATGFDLTKGTYTCKAYFSSIMDVKRDNDTLIKPVVINPALSVRIHPESGENSNCLTGEFSINPTITLRNTGNMDIFNIKLILRIDTTGNTDAPAYIIIEENCKDTISVGDSLSNYIFSSAYIVPWNARYYARIIAYLQCDSVLANHEHEITECVDLEDFYVASIDNPSVAGGRDNVREAIYVKATVGNHSDMNPSTGLDITVSVRNSQGQQTDSFSEKTGAVGISATVNHTFTKTYTVPDDTVYYLSVYINSRDNYANNDTVTIKRTTDYTGISTTGEKGEFILYQNIPNPANKATRIDYNIPQAGEVIFCLHNIIGEQLYSETIQATSGKHTVELNTNVFSAGVYFYSIEYKGQKRVKQLIISN